MPGPVVDVGDEFWRVNGSVTFEYVWKPVRPRVAAAWIWRSPRRCIALAALTEEGVGGSADL